MMFCQIAYLIIILIASVTLAQQQQNAFINPPSGGASGVYSSNPGWAFDSRQTLSWRSDYSTWILTIYHDDHAGGDPKAISGISSNAAYADSQGTVNYPWMVDTDTNYTAIPVYWFILYEGNNYTQRSFSSHYINITKAVSTSASGSKSSTSRFSTISITSAATAKIPPVSTTTVYIPTTLTPTKTAEPDVGEGLGTGAQAGIGVGVAAVVITSALGGYFLWRRRQKKARSATETAAAVSSEQQQPQAEYYPSFKHELDGGQAGKPKEPPAELATDTPPAQEMPATEQPRTFELA